MTSTSDRLATKVAVVTGGAHGIGRAITERFVSEGARVLIADRAVDAGASVAEQLGDVVRAVDCDVADSTSVAAAVDTAVSTFGGLDIMVNNAASERAMALLELDDSSWQRSLDVNLSGVFYGIRHGATAISASGGGTIINVSSIAAHRAMPGLGAYSATKAGVEALTRTAAVELRDVGIRVNAIAPGLIRTAAAERRQDMLEPALGEPVDRYLARHQGRWGEPVEIASVALHLASDESSFTSGITYVVDHGSMAG